MAKQNTSATAATKSQKSKSTTARKRDGRSMETRTTTRRLEDIECDLTLVKSELRAIALMLKSLGAKMPEQDAFKIHEHNHKMHLARKICDGGTTED